MLSVLLDLANVVSAREAACPAGPPWQAVEGGAHQYHQISVMIFPLSLSIIKLSLSSISFNSSNSLLEVLFGVVSIDL